MSLSYIKHNVKLQLTEMDPVYWERFRKKEKFAIVSSNA